MYKWMFENSVNIVCVQVQQIVVSLYNSFNIGAYYMKKIMFNYLLNIDIMLVGKLYQLQSL